MTRTKIKLRGCDCGGVAKTRCCRVAEDAEEAWVECQKCGMATERCEDAYADFDTVWANWNDRYRLIPAVK